MILRFKFQKLSNTTSISCIQLFVIKTTSELHVGMEHSKNMLELHQKKIAVQQLKLMHNLLK